MLSNFECLTCKPKCVHVIRTRKYIHLALIQSKVMHFTKTQICELLVGIPTSPINKISEALNDIQSIARGVLTQWNGHTVLASPLRFISDR